jgi:hypothetical protein
VLRCGGRCAVQPVVLAGISLRNVCSCQRNTEGGSGHGLSGKHTSTTVHASSLDVAVWSVGRASAFPTPLVPLNQAEASAGIYAVLHDNYVSDRPSSACGACVLLLLRVLLCG